MRFPFLLKCLAVLLALTAPTLWAGGSPLGGDAARGKPASGIFLLAAGFESGPEGPKSQTASRIFSNGVESRGAGSDPVNRWDPSGLFWRFRETEGKLAWEWIEDGGPHDENPSQEMQKLALERLKSDRDIAYFDILPVALIGPNLRKHPFMPGMNVPAGRNVGIRRENGMWVSGVPVAANEFSFDNAQPAGMETYILAKLESYASREHSAATDVLMRTYGPMGPTDALIMAGIAEWMMETPDGRKMAGTIGAGAGAAVVLGVALKKYGGDKLIPNRITALANAAKAKIIGQIDNFFPQILDQSTINALRKTAGNEAEVIARGKLSHLNGAIGEAHGWSRALDSGHLGIQPPGKVTAPGVDFATFDPMRNQIVLWDAKYRGPKGSYPTTIPASKMGAWTKEVRSTIEAMPEGPLRKQYLEALENNRIRGEIFRWPQ